MPYWAACRLQPNRTALALHCLTLQGYETYCTRLGERRVLHGRRVEVLLPLFPGYTFLRVVTGWWQAIEAPPKLRPGDRVRVLCGPFRD
jgi:hypothetical protein